MKVFSDEKLIEALAALPAAHRVAFAASTSERLFPNYEAFVAEQGAGDPAALRESLDLVWRSIERGEIIEARVRELMEHVEGTFPNQDDFFGFFTNLAGEANVAVYYTLESTLAGDAKCASIPAHYAVESIDWYLLGVGAEGGHYIRREGTGARFLPDADAEDEHLDRWVSQSPLMLAELMAQDEDLAALQAAPALTPELLRALRERSQKGGIRPFERGLVRRDAIPVNPRPIPPPYECDECEGCGRGDDGEACTRCVGSGRVRTLIHRGPTKSA